MPPSMPPSARRREGAEAYRDQEMARLFNECGWTQEKIARKMGKKQTWVSLRLVFARFLIFIADRNKSEGLTEWKFRKLYSGTRGTEKERFECVLGKLGDTVPLGYRNQVQKPGPWW